METALCTEYRHHAGTDAAMPGSTTAFRNRCAWGWGCMSPAGFTSVHTQLDAPQIPAQNDFLPMYGSPGRAS